MAKLTLNSTSTGSVSFDAPVTTENTIITVPAANAGMQVMRLETAQNTTSGTSIDFTGIPSWVKKITVMLNGVSTNGTSQPIIQLGSGTMATTGYTADVAGINGGTGQSSTSVGHSIIQTSTLASNVFVGNVVFTLQSGTTWIGVGTTRYQTGGAISFHTSLVALSGTLDRLRLTTINGTDTFDAGSVNILYEGY